MGTTLTAEDTAAYFLALVEEDEGELMSHLKLQKLCYYAQGFHLAITGHPLFDDRIEAWTHGPVVPALWRRYQQYEDGPIPKVEVDFAKYPTATREILDEVYQVYGQFAAWKLRNMTGEESPWLAARASGADAEITHASLRDYFSDFVLAEA